MLLPNDASVKPFEQAALNSLLIGRFRDAGPNFVAIRTERQVSTGAPSPYMAMISSWIDNQPMPYLSDPHGGAKVLDLGTNWIVDVPVDDNQPAFFTERTSPLIRLETNYYVQLNRGQGYVDLSTGVVVDNLPSSINVAFWSKFRILLSQDGDSTSPVEVFQWPREDN